VEGRKGEAEEKGQGKEIMRESRKESGREGDDDGMMATARGRGRGVG
jgi:hypothetical protein